MKLLIIALTLFTSLANASVTDDAKQLKSLMVEAGDAGHACTMLIDLKQPAALYCDKFRELVYRINSLDAKHVNQGTRPELLKELKPMLDNSFKGTMDNIEKAANRLGVEL